MRETPVILVHGFMATPALMRPMQHQLKKRGFEAYLSNLSPFCIQDIRRLATELSETIERVCFVEDVDIVDVVGVSLGGITALHYQQSVASQPRIRSLVAIGTPFLGTSYPRPYLPVLGRVSAGVWQVLPGSSFLAEMLDAGIPAGTVVTSIAMEGDPISPPGQCALPGADNIVLRGVQTPVTHQLLVASPVALQGVVSALEAGDQLAATPEGMDSTSSQPDAGSSPVM